MVYEEEALDQLEHAYAMSVHKSQGSEYKAVVVPLVMQHYPLLRKTCSTPRSRAAKAGRPGRRSAGPATRSQRGRGPAALHRLASRLHAILAP